MVLVAVRGPTMTIGPSKRLPVDHIPELHEGDTMGHTGMLQVGTPLPAKQNQFSIVFTYVT